MSLRDFSDTKNRREYIEKKTKHTLSGLGEALIDTKDIHCENLIGAISIPLGVAGPITIKNQHSKSTTSHYIPLATTEGALVASVNRGCKVIRECGGVSVFVERIGTTRGPVLQTSSIKQAVTVIDWMKDNLDQLQNIASSTSNHLKLRSFDFDRIGKTIYIRFVFDTDQAMGMNMVTIATDKLISYITQNQHATCLGVAGNYDTDKKTSWLNIIRGRGKKLSADISIPSETLSSILHVQPFEIEQLVKYKCWGGSIISGSTGFNAHFANIVGAFFLATGQDAGHIAEGSLGATSADVQPDGSLYFAVDLPDIMLGVVGGGTKLKTQTEARSITQTTNVDELAGVLAGAVLAGELSLLASIATQTLSSSHKKLGR